jgi:pyoverdine/dityrosine biosynthesis protein Dit1
MNAKIEAVNAGSLPDDFDPSFVMLSPSASMGESTPGFHAPHADLPVVERSIDYQSVTAEAERNARHYIGVRWRDIKSAPPAEQIASLLAGRRYRAGPLTARDEFAATIRRALCGGGPVEFVLPSFPFKIPNPGKVAHRTADYAEVLCLQRLYEITEVVRELGGTDSVFRIISDGKIYAGISRIGYGERTQYFTDVVRLIAAMSATHALSVVDMLDDVVGDLRGEVWRDLEAFTPALRRWWDARRNQDKVRYLVRNMTMNIDLGAEMSAFTRVLACAEHGSSARPDNGALGETAAELARQVHERADKAAFEFTALLTALRRSGVIAVRYPRAIRATVHPKAGQWGIHLVNQESRVFPWQGVALQTQDGNWRVVPQSQALQRAAALVVDSATSRPLYYSERPAPCTAMPAAAMIG